MSKLAKLIVIVLAFAMVSCSYENTATVTIDTGIRKQAQLSLFDRVLAWLTFANPVTADPVPGDVIFEELTLTVSASDMSSIVQHYSRGDIINNNGKITLEIPAGSQRMFEVVAGNGGTSRIYGGIATVDLSPGQNVNLNIEMGRFLYLGDYEIGSFDIDFVNNTIQIIFYNSTVPIRGALGFKIYYSENSDPNNATLLGTTANWVILYENQDETSSIRIDTGVDLLETWDIDQNQIGICIINKYGEGEIYFL